MKTLGLIGGSGLNGLLATIAKDVNGQYEPRERCDILTLPEKRVIFVPRHGRKGETPASEVDHCSNMGVFVSDGCKDVIAFSATGSLDEKVPIGSFVVPDDVVRGYGYQPVNFGQYTKHAAGERYTPHADMKHPFDPALRKRILSTAKALGYAAHDGGVYIHNAGDAFETRAEIKLQRKALANADLLDGSQVGMTACAEVFLARQKDLDYALVCIPVNYAQGISKTSITHEQTKAEIKKAEGAISALARKLIEEF
jgi:5'-methylthioadenosine phosphorylase